MTTPAPRRSFIAFDGVVTAQWRAGWNQPDNPLLAGAHRIAVRVNPGRTVDVVELTEAEHAAVYVDITRPINITGR